MFKFLFLSPSNPPLDISSSVLSFTLSSSLFSPVLEAQLILLSSSLPFDLSSSSFIFVQSSSPSFSSLFSISSISPFSPPDSYSSFSFYKLSLISIYEFLNSNLKISFTFSGSLSSFISQFFPLLSSSLPSFLSPFFSLKSLSISSSSDFLLLNHSRKSFFNILLSFLPYSFSSSPSDLFDTFFFFEFFDSFYFLNLRDVLSSSSFYSWFFNSPDSPFSISSFSSSLQPPSFHNNFSSLVYFLDPFTGKLSSFIFPPSSTPKFKFFFVSPNFDTSLSNSLYFNPFYPLSLVKSFFIKNNLFSSSLFFSSQSFLPSPSSLHNIHIPNISSSYNPFLIFRFSLNYTNPNSLIFHYTSSPVSNYLSIS